MVYLTGQADAMQIDEVSRWLSVSDEHAGYLKSLEMLWIETGKLTPPPVAVDTPKAWEKVSEKLNFGQVKPIDIHEKNKASFKLLWRAAAIVVLLIGAYGIFKTIHNGRTITFASSDQIISDTLTDGSVITLNTNSTIRFPRKFDTHERKVKLKGEAFFDVAHDAERPFTVELTDGATVRVVGTSFNIKELPETGITEVYVVTGTVELSTVDSKGKETGLILNAGEKGRIDTRKGLVERQADIGMNAVDISWMNHTFIFDGVKLKDVAGFLEIRFGVDIGFKNKQTEQRLLSATFNNDDIDEILQIIAESFNLKLIKENGTYTFDESDH